MTVAVEFLEWLPAGGRGLGELQQGDLEEWLSTPPTTRWQVHAFIVWAVDSRLAKGVRMPAHHFGQREQLTGPCEPTSSAGCSSTAPLPLACAPPGCSCCSTPSR